MLLTALMLGLLGSFHCLGMCGPIAFLLPVDRFNPLKKFIQIFVYHFGRLFAYSMMGLVFGLVGKGFNLFGMQQQLSIVIGLAMILFVLIPSQKFNTYVVSKPIFRIIAVIKTSLGEALRKKTPDTFLTIGFLNGFLPCGLVYMAVFGAIASGTALKGSVYMMLFGLGTIPLMTMAVYLGTVLSGKVRQHIKRSIPIFVVLIGCLFVIRGMGLGIAYLSPAPMVETVDANYECPPSSNNLIN